jgi:enamine deaminase RidA (YjgF/YER057c/UK114 family)
MLRIIALGLGLALVLTALWGQDPDEPAATKKKRRARPAKKDVEPITQVLPLPKELPAALTVEPQKLVFHVSPLSNRGLLSQQVRDGVKALFSATRGATIVRLRALVAGSGDTRRVATLVSEMFTEARRPLPVLTTVHTGLLPMEGAQVQFEAASVTPRAANPNGVALISGQIGPSLDGALAELQRVVDQLGLGAEDVAQMTCFVASLEGAALRNPYPQAAVTMVQMKREPVTPAAECEAVARLRAAPASPVEFFNHDPAKVSPNYSQVARVNPSKLVLTGLQMAFANDDAAFRLGFERLGRTLDSQGAKFADVVMMRSYALTPSAVERARALRFNYFNRQRPPASTLLTFEGLPSLDAVFGIDVMAALP